MERVNGKDIGRITSGYMQNSHMFLIKAKNY